MMQHFKVNFVCPECGGKKLAQTRLVEETADVVAMFGIKDSQGSQAGTGVCEVDNIYVDADDAGPTRKYRCAACNWIPPHGCGEDELMLFNWLDKHGMLVQDEG